MAQQLTRRGALTSLVILSLAACDVPADQPVPENDEAAEELLPVYEQEVVVQDTPPLVHLADFSGTFDVTTGRLTIEQVDPEDWAVIETVELPDGTLRNVRQPLWCEVGVGLSSGRVELNTVLNSVFDNPDDCGFVPPDPFYSRYADDTGMFCATISARSHATTQLDNVYAYITETTDGFFGHRYPYGTGANLAETPVGPGMPNDLLGLWSFGDLTPEVESRVQWTFENPGGSFAFHGSLLGTFSETCNGRDSDCNGRVDDGAGCYPDGESCIDGIDCATGVCSDGRCGISSVDGRDFVQVSGEEETLSGPSYNLSLRVGAPAPMGRTQSDGHTFTLGPIHR